jgi:hypothetical protein
MLRYSELSKPQKALIAEMRKGKELRYYYGVGYFLVDIANVCTRKVNSLTANGLSLRHYILECSDSTRYKTFCVNIDIDGFGTKF